MSITAIASSATRNGTEGRHGRTPPVPASRALVPLDTPRAAPRATVASSSRRITPDAAILAHLWATRENLGQTRARRRATPGTVQTAYERANGLRGQGTTAHSRVV